MPFDSNANAIYGTDALVPLEWARRVFCEWLVAKLNDSNGDYASALALTESRPAFVLEDLSIARAMYKRADAPPVVSLMQGPVDARDWYPFIGGQEYTGERLDIEWTLDMGVRDATPDNDDLAQERRDDSNLAGFVRDAVKRGFDNGELQDLGLFNVDIEPDAEKQRAGKGRHPHAVTLFIRTVRDFTP